MRWRDYLATASKNIRRQAVRSGLTIVAIGISSTILITLVALSLGAKKALVNQLSPDGSLTNIIVTPNRQTGATLFGSAEEVSQNTHVLNDDDVKRLSNLPHVQSASPTANVWELKNFRVDGTDKNFLAQTQGIAYSPLANTLTAGEYFMPDSNRHEAIIGYTYAKELGLVGDPQALIGKSIVFTTQDGYRGDGANLPDLRASRQQWEEFAHTPTKLSAKIIGVTGEGSTENSLLIPMAWARQIRTQSADPKPIDQIATQGYSTILIKTDNVASVRPVAEAINHLGFGEISTLDQLDRLMQFSVIMWVILGSIALIALIAASLGVVNTMMMSVAEQRYIIGVLRACGARRAVIAKLFLVEAALLGFIGGIVGVGLGLAAIFTIDQKIALLLKAQNLPVAHIAYIPWWVIAGGVVVPVIFGVIAGLYPAYKAAREDPARILAGV